MFAVGRLTSLACCMNAAWHWVDEQYNITLLGHGIKLQCLMGGFWRKIPRRQSERMTKIPPFIFGEFFQELMTNLTSWCELYVPSIVAPTPFIHRCLVQKPRFTLVGLRVTFVTLVSLARMFWWDIYALCQGRPFLQWEFKQDNLFKPVLVVLKICQLQFK